MRSLVVATILAVATTSVAHADETVAGTWRADMGGGVAINMNVGPNGDWSSQTSQNDKIVREMKGTYTQKKTNDHAGMLVFTPTEAIAKNGKVHKETDRYDLTGNQLKLTSNGDTMVFDKQEAK